jgi:hypothetical protein
LFVNAAALEEAVAYRVLRYVPALDPDGPEADVLFSRWLRAAAPEDDAGRRAAERDSADAQAVAADLEAARYERGEFPGHTGAERWRRLYERALFRLQAAEAALRAFPEPTRNVGGLFDREVLREALESDDEEVRRSVYRLTLARVEVEPGPGSDDLEARVHAVWATEAAASRQPLREVPLAV